MKIPTTATRLARWMAWLGLGCGVLYSFGGLVIDALTVGLNAGTLMAFGALVGMPLIFGGFGFVCGILITVGAGLLESVRRPRRPGD